MDLNEEKWMNPLRDEFSYEVSLRASVYVMIPSMGNEN